MEKQRYKYDFQNMHKNIHLLEEDQFIRYSDDEKLVVVSNPQLTNHFFKLRTYLKK